MIPPELPTHLPHPPHFKIDGQNMNVVGIDLGSEYSSIAMLNSDGVPILIPDRSNPGMFRTASLVHIGPNDCTVGDRCQSWLEDQPGLLVARRSKTAIGQTRHNYEDHHKRRWSAEAILALILAKLRNDAVACSHNVISQAVISVPALFNHLQRTALRQAADWIQLPVRELVDEPIAAARYLTDGDQSEKRVLIYSLGSEYFEASLVHCAQGRLKIISTNGCTNLGGRIMNTLIASEMRIEYQRLFGEGEYNDACEWQMLRLAEQAKIAMSDPGLNQITVQGLVGRKPFQFLLTRRHFEKLLEPKIESSLSLCDQTLSEAKMEWAEVDAVYLIGGSVSLTLLRTELMKRSGLAVEAISSRQSLHAAAFGAALIAAERTASNLNESSQSSYVSAYDVGIRIRRSDSTKAAVYRLIKRNSDGKSSASKRFKTSRDNQERLVLEVVQSRGRENSLIRLGYFAFGPFDGKPAGHPVDITMSYDSSGCVSIVATDPTSGKKVKHTVTTNPTSNSMPFDERERLQVSEYAHLV